MDRRYMVFLRVNALGVTRKGYPGLFVQSGKQFNKPGLENVCYEEGLWFLLPCILDRQLGRTGR
jgi:hypothetical protein